MARISQHEAQADREEARLNRFADLTREQAAQVLENARRYRTGIRRRVIVGEGLRVNLGETFPQLVQGLRLVLREPAIVDALDRFANAVWQLVQFEDWEIPVEAGDVRKFEQFDGAYGDARRAFERAIRDELRVP